MTNVSYYREFLKDLNPSLFSFNWMYLHIKIQCNTTISLVIESLLGMLCIILFRPCRASWSALIVLRQRTLETNLKVIRDSLFSRFPSVVFIFFSSSLCDVLVHKLCHR